LLRNSLMDRNLFASHQNKQQCCWTRSNQSLPAVQQFWALLWPYFGIIVPEFCFNNFLRTS
jgi:hypothetical protein